MARALSGDDLSRLTDDDIIAELFRRQETGSKWAIEIEDDDSQLNISYDGLVVDEHPIETLPDITRWEGAPLTDITVAYPELQPGEKLRSRLNHPYPKDPP